jgi:pimeloyl-ACP methyl ester carboxylesterase
MPVSRRLQTAAGLALLAGGGALAWELQRRADARRVAADPENAELDRELHGRPLSVTSADGTRLHVEVFGPEEAPAVVLVHGWLCSLQFWHYQIRDLSAEFRVVAYDQRGHGSSQPPRGGEYDIEVLGDDLHAVIEATVPRGQRCVVAGHSMGGMSVVAWAGRHADQVRDHVAAALVCSTGMGNLVEQAAVVRVRWMRRLREGLSARLGGASLPLPSSSTPISHRMVRFFALGPGASPAQVAFCERMILTCPAPVRAGFGRYFAQLELYTSVPRLDVPTVVMVGELDRLTPPWHARRLAEDLPQPLELIELPGIAHMTPVEAHEQVTEVIRRLARRYLGEGSLPGRAGRRPRRPVRSPAKQGTSG